MAQYLITTDIEHILTDSDIEGIEVVVGQWEAGFAKDAASLAIEELPQMATKPLKVYRVAENPKTYAGRVTLTLEEIERGEAGTIEAVPETGNE